MLPGLFWFIFALREAESLPLTPQPMRSEHLRQLLENRWALIHNGPIFSHLCNQLGHDLASETINEDINEMLPATANMTPGK